VLAGEGIAPGLVWNDPVPVAYIRATATADGAAFGFKTIVERAVRNRGDVLLAAFRSILNSGTTQAEPSARDHFLVQRTPSTNSIRTVTAASFLSHVLRRPDLDASARIGRLE